MTGRSPVSRRTFLLGLSAAPYALRAAAALASSAAAELDLKPLRKQFKGALIAPGDPGYESLRLTNNRAFDRHPLLIARCTDAEDVARVIEFTRARALPLAVRSGGHCAAGRSSCDGGVMIDLSRMDSIAVDPKRDRITCGPGARVYQANKETVKYGMALPLGICGDVGLAGLTLGGGYGYLMGVAGLACDSLVGAQIVMADSSIRTVSDDSDPDLMWALRGGGANFGVVTQMHFKPFRIGDIYGGSLSFPGAASAEIAGLVNDHSLSLPDQLTMFSSIATLPDGSTHPQISLCWSGDVAHGPAMVDKFITSTVKPGKEQLRVMSIDALVGRGDGTDSLGCVRFGDVAGKLPQAGLDAFLQTSTSLPIVRVATIDVHVGAATRRTNLNASAPSRPPGVGVGYLVDWTDAALTPAATAWTEQAWARLYPYTHGTYVNMLGDEPARVRAAYGVNYPRLAKLKAKYDPNNVLRLNQNIVPA
jgi:FAD/FMN-containing dehydrogenase